MSLAPEMMVVEPDAFFRATEVGRRIKCMAAHRGMTKTDIAKATGCDASKVAKWFAGSNCPNASSLFSLCRAFDCSADWLLGLKESPCRS